MRLHIILYALSCMFIINIQAITRQFNTTAELVHAVQEKSIAVKDSLFYDNKIYTVNSIIENEKDNSVICGLLSPKKRFGIAWGYDYIAISINELGNNQPTVVITKGNMQNPFVVISVLYAGMVAACVGLVWLMKRMRKVDIVYDRANQAIKITGSLEHVRQLYWEIVSHRNKQQDPIHVPVEFIN